MARRIPLVDIIKDILKIFLLQKNWHIFSGVAASKRRRFPRLRDYVHTKSGTGAAADRQPFFPAPDSLSGAACLNGRLRQVGRTRR
jgi:hypothetical protein